MRIVSVVDPHGSIVPPSSILPFLARVSSSDKKLLWYEGISASPSGISAHSLDRLHTGGCGQKFWRGFIVSPSLANTADGRRTTRNPPRAFRGIAAGRT